MNLILRTCLTVFIVISATVADRRKEATMCGDRIHSDHPLDLSQGVGALYRPVKGTFHDYEENLAEQISGEHVLPSVTHTPEQRIKATNYANQKVDAKDLGSSPAALAQEGRSFCVSGEHFKNVPELFNHLNFRGMQALAMNNFDIGTHSHPSDYALMNTYNWKDSNKPMERPVTPSMRTLLDTNDERIYDWEDSEETFFHTRVSKYKVEIDFPTREVPIGFKNRPSVMENQPDPKCRNPYFIQVTEIDANGVRLHNWLHITVYVRRENIVDKPKCATGKMRYIMLEVRDSLGFPVGDFNAEVDCGTSCKCKSSNCKMIKRAHKNGLPCMISPMRSITQPGIFMYSAKSGDYFDEVHVDWHFAQHTSYFVYQLHFAALIVEDATPTRYYTSRQTSYENPLFCLHRDRNIVSKTRGVIRGCRFGFDKSNEEFVWIYSETIREYDLCGYFAHEIPAPPLGYYQLSPLGYSRKYAVFASRNPSISERPKGYYAFKIQHIGKNARPYGWTAQYTAVYPTIQTLGAWDIFRKKYTEISRMNCHRRLDSEFFEETGTATKGKLPYRANMYKFVKEYNVYEADGPVFGENLIFNKSEAIRRASNDSSEFHTKYFGIPITNEFGDFMNSSMLANSTFVVPKFYFGTQFTREAYTSDYLSKMPKNIRDNLNKRQSWDMIADQERCACPALATTPDPEDVTRPAPQLQGRRSHAAQMFLAWIVLVPLGMFVIRYFKETYSRVFLLQEFWWYSVHALCMGTAWMFMLGGIYTIEIKRLPDESYTLSDEALVHIIMGYAAIVMFTIQLFITPFRLWSVQWRIIQIILHFTFGMIEYSFAVVCVFLAAVIPQGRMSCSAFSLYVAFLIIQIIVYALMELHMRYVDKLMDLIPPRTYLPPPVMRLFHTNAPLSKFRVYILVFYAIFLWISFIIMQNQVSTHIASCFHNLGNDYEEESY